LGDDELDVDDDDSDEVDVFKLSELGVGSADLD
jgi:hypothetical protein